MISNEVVEQRLLENKEVCFVKVDGDGYHYQLIVVSDVFIGKPQVQRHQWVYGKLKDFIKTGELHALNMTTWTKDEWEKKNG